MEREMSDYLLFSLNSIRYCIDALPVREIFWLPALAPIEETPSYIVGMLNLRGHVLPVMSLDLRFQHPPKPVQLSDHVIVLHIDDIEIGLIVSRAYDVVSIAASDIEPVSQLNRNPDNHTHFIAGNAKIGDDIWMVLNLDHLIHAPDPAYPTHKALSHPDLFTRLPAPEREIFHERSKHLAHDGDTKTADRREGFAVIQLGKELYAIAMSEVREFCHLERFTPIPCCPSHIMGDMNLRGDILTLVDLRPMLAIGLEADLTKVMVVESDDLRVGIPVSEVLDVIYLSPGDYLPLPAHETNQDYCTGAIRFHPRIANILDIKMLLAQGDLEVNEEV